MNVCVKSVPESGVNAMDVLGAELRKKTKLAATSQQTQEAFRTNYRRVMVGLGRLELPTRSLGNCCSIHLSYSPAEVSLAQEGLFPKAWAAVSCAPTGFLVDAMDGLLVAFRQTTYPRGENQCQSM
jgi:hypothetical protein